ncbi:hypothetical protein C0J52_24996 [Blattella germanica]|nr:hypothetical protein C0J52_24996 [Blattella germanica]
MSAFKVLVLSTAVLTLCRATPPPGYVKKPDNDKDPPKYEFGYDVRDGKGARQGHLETRDGVYALGMYYVNLPDGSGQSVRYFADDWGYHPLVSYSSASDSGSTKTHFALGEKAVAALSKTKDNSKISPSGVTADTVAGNALKLQAEVSSGPKNGDILKIRHGKKPTLPSNVGGSESTPVSLYQAASHPTDSEQVEVSAINNLLDSNVDRKGDVKYETITPVYTATQLVPESGYSSVAPGGPSNYESQGEYQVDDGAKGTGSSSYQLVEIGSESSKSGDEVSGTQSNLFLPLISDSHNTESGKSSNYNTGRKQKISTYVSNKNSVLQFGDKIPNTGDYSSQTAENGETDQNEIYEEQKIQKAPPTPEPQQYSLLRPIVVAEIYPKEEQKEVTQTIRPIVVSPTSPAFLHISHSPKASSTYTFSSSKDHSKTSSGVKDNQEAEGGEYSADSALSSYSSGNSGEISQYVVSHSHSTPKPAVVSFSQETSSYSSSGSDGSESVGIQQENIAHAEPLIYTTPSPIVVSYSQSTSHSSNDEARGGSQSIITSNVGNSGHISSSVKHTASPIILLYSQPPLTHYSTSSASEHGTASGAVGGYVSSTPASILLSQSQESSSSVITSSGSEENTQQQSVSAIKNIASQHSSPSSIYVSHTPQSSSYSVSSSDSSQSSGYITATNNGNSGHVQTNSVHSTTIRPDTVSSGLKSEGISSQNYVVSSTPAPVLIDTTYLSVPPVLTSSVLAPIQAGVSLGATSHQQHSVSVSPVQSVTAEPPQVKEEVDDVPQEKTVVEIQKAISLDFNELTKAKNQEQKADQTAIAQPESSSYIQQGDVKPETQVTNIQQNVDSGNLIQYSYAQPFVGLHFGYSQPLQQSGHLVYTYPQIFESHKITHSEGNTHQQGQNEVHYEQNVQLVDKEKQELEYAEKQVGNVVLDYKEQKVTEPEETSQKYEYTEQLSVQSHDNQQNQHHIDIGKQQLTSTYHQESTRGEHQILSQHQLPEETHIQTGYNQPLIHTENKIYDLHPPVQQIFHQPVQVSQPIQIQFPIDYQVQQINQQVEYQTPDLNQQIGATAFAQQSSQTNVQISQSNSQVAQTPSQVKPAYSKNPGEITKQLQSEYKHQLKEEEKQEQAKFSSQINEYKQIGDQGKSVLSTALAAEIQYPQSHITQESEKDTKSIETETVSVHHPKIIEKPITVHQPVPVEVTKLVAVEKPVPYPQPYAVPHPVPVPIAVPHPIEVPVPHLVPYPHVVAVPYKEIHPIYFTGKHNKHETATYHYETQNFPKDTPLPAILKSLQYQGGRYGVPVSVKSHHFHSSRTPESIYLAPPPLKSGGRGRGQHSKYHDHFRTLCLEYGFKPPLIPSIQIDEVPASAYGPPQKL